MPQISHFLYHSLTFNTRPLYIYLNAHLPIACHRALRDRLKDIKEKVYKEGRIFVFDSKLNLLFRKKRSGIASPVLLRIAKENPKKYSSKEGKYYFIVVEVTINLQYNHIFDKVVGGINIHASMMTKLLTSDWSDNKIHIEIEDITTRNDKKRCQK